MEKGKKKSKGQRKNVPLGVAHVKSTFNNTIITITDNNGNTIAWSSTGIKGFKGSRKGTPYAAHIAAADVAKKAMDRKTGARGLRSILEQALLNTMYDLPSLGNVKKVVIDEGTIKDGAEPLLIYENNEQQSGTE